MGSGSGAACCWKPCAVMPRTANEQSTSTASPANTRFISVLLLEIDFGERGGGRRHFEVRGLLEPVHLRRHVAGKAPRRGVVFLDPLVVAHARDRQPVLGAGELVHQAVELFVGLE